MNVDANFCLFLIPIQIIQGDSVIISLIFIINSDGRIKTEVRKKNYFLDFLKDKKITP